MMQEKLIPVVEKYLNSSLFYRERYAGLRISSFADIPFIEKKDLLRDQIDHPPFGSNMCVARTDLARIHRTSGTSTKPLLILVTRNDVEMIAHAGAKAFQLSGMGPGDIVVNCMNYSMWMGGFMDHMSMELTGAAVVPYGVGQTENLIDLLIDLDNPSIHSTPSYLEVIKKKFQDKYGKSPKDLGIVKGFFGGESGMQNPVFRKKIEAEWGMTAMNANYGLSEVISILGAECSQRDGLYFTAQPNLYVELFNLEKQKTVALEAGAMGEIVLTHLSKEAQPLVRYRTGDIIEILSTSPCACGEDSFRFRIVGRRDDMIVVKGVNFFPESVRSIISLHPECSGMYKVLIPQEDPISEFKLLIQVKEKAKDHSLATQLRHELKNRLSVSPKIELVDSINVEGNKIRLVERVPYV
jgi:phenylacetate-CoA ligase